jgi:NADH:quinone reductase (non-electrogenic)
VAQGAIQMGRLVAEIIRREVEGNGAGEERPVFYYKDKGSMATIGRGKAVTTIGSRTLNGFLGWLAWGGVHMFFLVNFRSRVSVILEWFWNYLSGERRSRLIQGEPHGHVKEVRGVRMFEERSQDEG